MKHYMKGAAVFVLAAFFAAALFGCETSDIGADSSSAAVSDAVSVDEKADETEKNNESILSEMETVSIAFEDVSSDENNNTVSEEDVQSQDEQQSECSEENDSEDTNDSEAESSTPEDDENETDGSLYDKLAKLVTNSGADSYTVCHIEGMDNYQLILSFGVAEAERYYEVYTIESDDTVYAGQLAGSHTSAYIDSNTSTLGIYYGHMGSWAYGLVEINSGNVSETYSEQGYAEPGEDYPEIPGEVIEFTPKDNLEPLSNFR